MPSESSEARVRNCSNQSDCPRRLTLSHTWHKLDFPDRSCQTLGQPLILGMSLVISSEREIEDHCGA